MQACCEAGNQEISVFVNVTGGINKICENLCDILGICNGGEKVNNQALGEPYPSKSQSYPYSDIPFASSQVQSFVVAAPTKVNDKI